MQASHTSWIYLLAQLVPRSKAWNSPPTRSTLTTGVDDRATLSAWAFQMTRCGHSPGTRNCTCFRHLWKQCAA
eukprot:14033829-Ditylum_brightwellii.AAC.1